MSLLPSYNPRRPEQAGEDAAGLAAFLMQSSPTAFAWWVLNQGQQGHHVELHWRLPDGVAEQPAAARTSPAAPQTPAPTGPEPTIRPLRAPDRSLARLMYRSYGFSTSTPTCTSPSASWRAWATGASRPGWRRCLARLHP
ncbi:MAG: hypothetical protein U1E57_08090 [Paenacidovorax caeni]